MMKQTGISTSKIARIWVYEDGTFVVCDWDNEPISPWIFKNDAEAGEYAKNNGFEEIFWMEA